MPFPWKKWAASGLKNVQKGAMAIVTIATIQILLSVLVWQVLFRRFPQGFSMGLTLVGFASWFFSMFPGRGSRRYAPGGAMPFNPLSRLEKPAERSAERASTGSAERDGARTNSAGCLLFIASLIPLGIAFALRVRADLNSGKTWQDIFPPMD